MATDIPTTSVGARRAEVPPATTTSATTTGAIVLLVIAALYFGRDVFIPVALSALLSFALAPPVRWLRRVHVPRILSVLVVVSLAFAAILAFASVVAWQVADLARQLPTYQRNIEAKIEDFRESPPGGRVFERASEVFRDIGRKIEEEAETPAAPDAAGVAAPDAEQPLPVEVHEPEASPLELLQAVVGPLVGPLATAGIVIVFVIFMLLKREDLRDRMIRLAGTQDLSRTTEAVEDAARRVGHYLLMQLVVNATYGLPVGIGLWLIGVPNPILWGMLATVLRFIPYIGPIISAFFPLALAIAVDPGWETLLLTGAMLIVIELISNNVIEPWLYGASTGLSPVAIIAAAIFWTWLWGPIGLLLSTPLTVCLVVLGQHVPQLQFLDVMFGSEPVLTPAQTLYQRLLGGDPDEATERAEELLRERPLLTYYDEVALPALAMAEHDRHRGALDEARRAVLADSAMALVDNLREYEAEPPAAPDATPAEAAPASVAVPAADLVLPSDRLVVCAAARGNLDEVAAGILAQLVEKHGGRARVLPCDCLGSHRLSDLHLDEVGVVVLSYMNADSLAHARFLVRRLRRRFPEAGVLIGFWTLTPEMMAGRDPVAATGADRVATSLADAMQAISQILGPERTLSPDADEGKNDQTPLPVLATAAE